MQSEYEKMIAGEIYRPQDEDLRKIRARSKNFNIVLTRSKTATREVLLSKNGLAAQGRILL